MENGWYASDSGSLLTRAIQKSSRDEARGGPLFLRERVVMNYVQFHIGDWLAGTRFLSLVEKGVYMELLMLYYSEERPIKRTNFDRITKGYTEEERQAFDYVIDEFFIEENDGFHHSRCDKEIATCREKSEKARRSVAARWKKSESKSNCKPNETRPNNERNTDELLTNNQEPITKNHIDMDMVERDAIPPVADLSSVLFEEEREKIKRPECVAPECEYKKVVDLYHEKLASKGLPSVSMLSQARKSAIKGRWNDFVREEGFKTADEVLGGFEYYFDMVADSPFLMGRVDPSYGHSKRFNCTFDWLMKSANFLKVLEGNYGGK